MYETVHLLSLLLLLIPRGLHDQYIDRFAALSLNVVSGSWYIESQERKYPVCPSCSSVELFMLVLSKKLFVHLLRL